MVSMLYFISMRLSAVKKQPTIVKTMAMKRFGPPISFESGIRKLHNFIITTLLKKNYGLILILNYNHSLIYFNIYFISFW